MMMIGFLVPKIALSLYKGSVYGKGLFRGSFLLEYREGPRLSVLIRTVWGFAAGSWNVSLALSPRSNLGSIESARKGLSIEPKFNLGERASDPRHRLRTSVWVPKNNKRPFQQGKSSSFSSSMTRQIFFFTLSFKICGRWLHLRSSCCRAAVLLCRHPGRTGHPQVKLQYGMLRRLHVDNCNLPFPTPSVAHSHMSMPPASQQKQFTDNCQLSPDALTILPTAPVDLVLLQPSRELEILVAMSFLADITEQPFL
jgi:hypothetical protein